MPEDSDAHVLLSDKDSAMAAVQVSHDNHLTRILGKEDEVREKEVNGINSLIDNTRKGEYARTSLGLGHSRGEGEI